MAFRLMMALIGAIALLGGCRSQSPIDEPISAATTAPAGMHGDGVGTNAPPLPDRVPARAPPDVLASRTAAFAHTAETLLSRRPPTAAPATTASAVEWVDSAGLRLNPDPRTTVRMNTDGGPASAPAIADASWGRVLGTPVVSDVKPPPAREGPLLPSDQLEKKLYRQIKEQPKDIVAHLDYQLLQLVRDEPVPGMGMISPLPSEDREMLSAMMDALSNFRNAVRGENNMLSNRKVRPLLEMADRLRAQADLRIANVALCTRVDGFGSYDPIEPARFPAGKDHAAILYCEIENFASHATDKGTWETKLTLEVVLYTETGMPLWPDKARPIVDLSRNRRHDFYLIKRLTLPSTLPIGRYLLKVTVVDQLANRVSENTMPVNVVAAR